MLDWLGKMLDLPKEFLACSGGKGGGVIQVNLSKSFFNEITGIPKIWMFIQIYIFMNRDEEVRAKQKFISHSLQIFRTS